MWIAIRAPVCGLVCICLSMLCHFIWNYACLIHEKDLNISISPEHSVGKAYLWTPVKINLAKSWFLFLIFKRNVWSGSCIDKFLEIIWFIRTLNITKNVISEISWTSYFYASISFRRGAMTALHNLFSFLALIEFWFFTITPLFIRTKIVNGVTRAFHFWPLIRLQSFKFCRHTFLYAPQI